MKKLIVNDCTQYFTALKEIKKGVKAQILEYDEDKEIDEDFAAEEIIKLSEGFPIELWTADTLDYVYKKKYVGHMWQNIRKKYMLAVTEEIEEDYEESAYLIQFGKARIAQKSIKQAINYLKGVSMSSFLLIGEFEQTDELMELLPKLKENYAAIANIVNLVCNEKGIDKVIYFIQGMDGASLTCFSFEGGESI